jgi:beta-glucosidase
VWSKQPTTLFPAAIAMGATWDPELVRTITGAMGDEARALCNIGADGPRSKHGLVFRSPVINISRNPLWGRIQEVFSEDPFLTGRMGVAYVRRSALPEGGGDGEALRGEQRGDEPAAAFGGGG